MEDAIGSENIISEDVFAFRKNETHKALREKSDSHKEKIKGWENLVWSQLREIIPVEYVKKADEVQDSIYQEYLTFNHFSDNEGIEAQIKARKKLNEDGITTNDICRTWFDVQVGKLIEHPRVELSFQKSGEYSKDLKGILQPGEMVVARMLAETHILPFDGEDKNMELLLPEQPGTWDDPSGSHSIVVEERLRGSKFPLAFSLFDSKKTSNGREFSADKTAFGTEFGRSYYRHELLITTSGRKILIHATPNGLKNEDSSVSRLLKDVEDRYGIEVYSGQRNKDDLQRIKEKLPVFYRGDSIVNEVMIGNTSFVLDKNGEKYEIRNALETDTVGSGGKRWSGSLVGLVIDRNHVDTKTIIGKTSRHQVLLGQWGKENNINNQKLGDIYEHKASEIIVEGKKYLVGGNYDYDENDGNLICSFSYDSRDLDKDGQNAVAVLRRAGIQSAEEIRNLLGKEQKNVNNITVRIRRINKGIIKWDYEETIQ